MSDYGRETQAAIIVQIKAEMAAKDWNQTDLSAATGVATSTLSRYVAGTRDIPFRVFAEICLALGLSVPELLERAERRQKESVK